MKIWTSTVPGEWFLPTGQCGFLPRSVRDGRPIATAIGYGSAPGVGLGWMMPPGDSRPSTTVAGSMPDVGHGCRVLFTFVPSMPQRSSPGLAAHTWALASLSVTAMAGARWATENHLFPGMAEAV